MSTATGMLACLAVYVSLSVEHTWSIDTMTTPIWGSALQGRRDVAADQQTGTVGRKGNRCVMRVRQFGSYYYCPRPRTDPSS
jgi:hypothetical protein